MDSQIVSVPRQGPSGLHNTMPGKPPLGLQYAALKKGPSPMSVPGSKTNLSGERGVKYCLPGFNSELTLRSPPVPNANSYVVSQGYARGQQKGLAYQEQYQLDNPYLIPPNNFASSMKSRIPYPK
ncbi:hypothetical protein [Pleurochrysis sp. Polinton-like virus]|nr:hypothetical protein [Pleurochrysis sp. Polinton-like virus]